MPRYIDTQERRLYRAVLTKTIAPNRYEQQGHEYTFAEGPYTTAAAARRRLTHHQHRADESQGSLYRQFTVTGSVEVADVVWEPLE